LAPFNPDSSLWDKDLGFLKDFHGHKLQSFGHRDHLRLAWALTKPHGLDIAERLIKKGIKEFAEYQGAGNRYHETLTMFWVRIVNHAIQARPDIGNFDVFIESFPFLLDKNLPNRHWTSERLWNDSARASWIEPDLRPIDR
jgi:hypothetical protein